MAGSVIKIKRSTTKGAPSVGTLAPGELAYSGADAGTIAGGDRLYIGIGGTGAFASEVVSIGGTFYTDKLEVTPGTLTASKALVVDSNKKINEFFVDNLSFNGNVITSVIEGSTVKNLNLDANGLIQFYSSSNSYTFPKERGALNTVLKMGAEGVVGWGKAAVDLNIISDLQSGTVSLLDEDAQSLSIKGFSGIETTFNDSTNVLGIYGVHASNSDVGVASFAASDFDVDSAAHVSIKTERIQDMIGDMFKAGSGQGSVGGTNYNSYITVSYDDDDNRLQFDVNLATTSSAGVAKFNSNFFQFGTGGNNDTVSLNANIVQTVTVPSGTMTITSNTLQVANGNGIAVTGSGNTLTIGGVSAGNATLGIAQFPSTQFDMATPGTVVIRKATTENAEDPYFGVAQFDSTFFSVSSGLVSANAITIGNTDIFLGDNDNGGNDKAIMNLTGLTSIEVTSGAGNLKLSGSTIEQKLTDFDIVLKPLGTVSARGASIKIDSGAPGSYWVLPPTRGTGGAEITNEVLTIDKATGLATWKAPNQNVTIYGDNASGQKVLTVGAGSVKFAGTQGIATITSKTVDEASGQVVVTIQGQFASTGTVGVAKFNSASFDVSNAGDVTIKADGISNAQILNDYLSIGSTSISLGGSSSNLEGLNSIAFAGLTIGGSTLAGATPSEKAKRTITATGSGENLYLSGNGTGHVKISDAFFLPNNVGTTGQVLLTNASTGQTYWGAQAVTLKLAADNYDPTLESPLINGEYNLLTDGNLSFLGGAGITTYYNDVTNTFLIDGDLATKDTLGVASFAEAFFTVNDGAVTLADAGVGKGITNAKLVNSTIQIGTYAVGTNEPTALGSTITTLKGITGITTGNLIIGANGAANTIEAGNAGANGDVKLKTKGDGDIVFFDGKSYSFSLPRVRSSDAGLVLTSAGNGTTTWSAPVTTLKINDERGGAPHADTINLIDEELLFKDGVGIIATISGNAVTFDGVIANTGEDEDVVGVASFTLSQFGVNVDGKVTLNDNGVQDIVGGMLTGTGFVNTNIAVTYVPDAADLGAGKLSFVVPQATDSVKGVASFSPGDFSVGTALVGTNGQVTLAATVVKGISGNSGTATATSNNITIKGAAGSAIATSGSGTDLTISIATATATTMGVAFFPTGSGGDFIIGATGDSAGSSEGKISLRKATYTTSGVAKFASSQFSIDGLATDGTPDAEDGAGAVTIRPIKIGGQTITNGNVSAVTAFTGLTSVAIGDLVLATNAITATGAATNINIALAPKGEGTVAVGGKRIANLGAPSEATDAANKEYVDSKASGLTVKDPVRIASGPSATGYANANGVNTYGSVDLTYTVSTASTASYPIIDGRQLAPNDRVLLKNQGAVAYLDPVRKTVENTDSEENGIYVWKDTAGTSGWARAADANQDIEFTGATFLFVQDGDTWADTGWVLQTDWDPNSMTLDQTGSTLKFVQFSAAGVLKVDSNGGLYKTGGYIGIGFEPEYKGLGVNASNHLELSSTVAGAGLAISTDGIISVNVDDTTLELNNDSIRIKSTYTGQASITTVSSTTGITTGVWNATAISTVHGGTGLTSVNKGDLLLASATNTFSAYAMNGASNSGKVLQVVNHGTAGSPDYNVEYADIDGGEY
jgi:hypothetical protein